MPDGMFLGNTIRKRTENPTHSELSFQDSLLVVIHQCLDQPEPEQRSLRERDLSFARMSLHQTHGEVHV